MYVPGKFDGSFFKITKNFSNNFGNEGHHDSDRGLRCPLYPTRLSIIRICCDRITCLRLRIPQSSTNLKKLPNWLQNFAFKLYPPSSQTNPPSSTKSIFHLSLSNLNLNENWKNCWSTKYQNWWDCLVQSLDWSLFCSTDAHFEYICKHAFFWRASNIGFLGDLWLAPTEKNKWKSR